MRTVEELQQMEKDAALLDARIEESGLSARKFAALVLKRNERTVRRWQGRERPIPEEVRDFLEDPKPAPWP